MQPQSPYQPQSPQQPQVAQPGQTVQPQYGAPQAPPGPPLPPQAPQPYSQPQQTPVQPQQPYDFIMNPAAPPKKPLLPGAGSSLLARVGIVAGGLLVLMILFTVIKGFLSTEPPLTSLVTVAQDQQQLIQLSTSALTQQNATTEIRNFAATTQASVTSSQSAVTAYLLENGQKVNVKELALGINPALDERLETAAAATTYNQTFQEIMKSELTDYMSHLEQSYDAITGTKGRALLSDQYQQAKLLLEQITQSSASS